MSCCGFVDDLLIHIDIIEEIVLASVSFCGLIEYMYRNGSFESDGGWLVAVKYLLELGSRIAVACVVQQRIHEIIGSLYPHAA